MILRNLFFFLTLCLVLTAKAMDQEQTGQEKSKACAACHGEQGISRNPIWPSLAGQHARYLLKQLRDFKAKKGRDAPTMTAFVAQLNDRDLEDLALFYASQPRPEGKTPKRYLKLGERIYRGGDFDKQITACIACHGPRGTGNAQAGFPMLSGQQPAYTLQQLQAFKTGQRSNDLHGIMRDISARMSTEDLEAVAYYLSGLY